MTASCSKPRLKQRPVLKFVFKHNVEPYVSFKKASQSTRKKVRKLLSRARQREKNMYYYTQRKCRKHCLPFYNYLHKKYPTMYGPERRERFKMYREHMHRIAPRKQAELYCRVAAYCIAIVSKDQGHERTIFSGTRKTVWRHVNEFPQGPTSSSRSKPCVPEGAFLVLKTALHVFGRFGFTQHEP